MARIQGSYCRTCGVVNGNIVNGDPSVGTAALHFRLSDPLGSRHVKANAQG